MYWKFLSLFREHWKYRDHHVALLQHETLISCVSQCSRVGIGSLQNLNCGLYHGFQFKETNPLYKIHVLKLN